MLNIQEQILNVNTSSRKPTSSLILGILLTMPIYMLIVILTKILTKNLTIPDIAGELLFLFTMYIPPLAGLILSPTPFKILSKIFMIIMLLGISFGIYNFIQTYMINHEGWDGLGYMLMWLLSTGVMRFFSCLFCCTVVGWKKGLIYSGIGIAFIVLSFLLGFWE